MRNYYKYLPTSTEDERWGMHVLNCGYNSVNGGEVYPSPKHPSHHYFSWNKGRIHDEYQVVYICRGSGVFESASCVQRPVHEGTIMFLFPGEWHRYKPEVQSGWDEFWVGVKGNIIDNLVKQHFFIKENAVINIGLQESIIRLFSDIIEKTQEERAGYQPFVSGMVMQLLGEIHALTREKDFEQENFTEAVLKKSRVIIRTNFDKELTMEKVAEELNVSYAWFRKAFKNYTGIAPHQYLIQLRIEKAKQFLNDRSMSVKEIALRLNFDSSFYFSRIFKVKVGVSPDQYRKNRKI